MTKIALFSDVHSNWVAMNEMINHAQSQGAEQFISLGDLIGYGPQPLECLCLAKEKLNGHWVIGNHEELCWEVDRELKDEQHNIENVPIPLYWQTLLQKWVTSEPKYEANRMILKLTEYIYDKKGGIVKRDAIDPILRNLLEFEKSENAKEMKVWYFGKFQNGNHHGPVDFELDGVGIHWVILHATLNLPMEGYAYPWECRGFNDNVRMQQVEKAALAYKESSIDFPLCVCSGHTHVPLYCPLDHWEDKDKLDSRYIEFEKELPLGKKLTLINPGSIGHPSDCDPRLSYAMVDSGSDPMSVTYYRLDYENEMKQVIQKLRDDMYPNKIAQFIQRGECRAEDRNDPEVKKFFANRGKQEA